MITKLKKELNLLDVFCIASGSMISSGLFILPGLAHAQAGPAVIVSYFLAGLLALTGMLSQAELVSAMPKAGGTYFYVTRSMGSAVGTIDGLITWFSLSLKSAFALVGMAAFTKLLIALDIHIIAVALCVIFIIINFIGIKEAGKVQIILVMGLLSLLLLYVIKGLPVVKIIHFENFAPYGVGAIISTAGFVFISYGGLLKVASIAEEVKDPAKTVPLGMILSFLVVTTLYILVIFITTGVLAPAKLDASLTPITDGAEIFLGTKGRIFLSIAAILAFVSTANAGIMAASRYPFALSRDRLIPHIFKKVNLRFKTPHFAILFTGLFIITALFFKLKILVEAASTVLIITFIFSCLSIIILRESRIQNYQPRFKTPLYPWIQIIGILCFLFLIFQMGIESFIIGIIFITVGLLAYRFYGRMRTNREYALLHLIERITAKELTSHSLNLELKEIIRERDDIILDRFDEIIEKCKIMDIKESMAMKDFFKLISDTLGENLNIKPSVIFNLLIKREAGSSTVIMPGLAIPHIIIEGKNIFDILLIRCKKGIIFSNISTPVNTVFVLIGTKDERNFHLRALSAIAQIAQDIKFDKRWIAAKNENGLRDVILLGKRRRM
ncbi:amino acid permease [Spirochaetota bacterium]